MKTIDIGFKYRRKRLNTSNEEYFIDYEVIGKYYKYAVGGTTRYTKEDLIKNNPIVLQVAMIVGKYSSASIEIIEEKSLINTLIEDDKFQPEFKKYFYEN